MNDIDCLTEFIYMAADYLFYDATKYKNRVNIYNSAQGCLATIYVNSTDPVGTVIYDGNVNGSIEAINTMRVVIDIATMIYNLHPHPENAIRRLVDANV